MSTPSLVPGTPVFSLRHLRPLAAAAAMVVFALLSAGCQTAGRQANCYLGPPRPTNEVAVLRLDRGPCNAIVHQINGAPLAPGDTHAAYRTSRIDLLPGTYVLQVGYLASNSASSVQDALLVFTALAGREYRLHVAPTDGSPGQALTITFLGGQYSWDSWVEDLQTGAVVGGRPRAEPVHWWEQ